MLVSPLLLRCEHDRANPNPLSASSNENSHRDGNQNPCPDKYEHTHPKRDACAPDANAHPERAA